MPVWLSFILSVFAIGGFFGSVYFLVSLLIEAKRLKSQPKLSISGGSNSKLEVSVDWDVKQFSCQVYRIKVSHFSPDLENKEGCFSITYDPPQKNPFIQSIPLPDEFKEMLNLKDRASLWTFEARTLEHRVLSETVWLGKVRKIMSSGSTKQREGLITLPETQIDNPNISSLEYQELVIRKAKLSALEAAAKAKAAKAAAAKAATVTA